MPSDRDALMSSAVNTMTIDQRGMLIAWLIRIGVLLALVVVVARVLQLQIAPSTDLRSFVESRTSTSPLGATRGDLLDRRGRTLATTRMGYRVIVDPEGLRKAMQRDRTLLDREIVTLSGVLSTPADQFAPQIIQKIVRNEQIQSQAAGSDESPVVARYLRIGEV
ncbi:MAG: hypothetical protein NXI07_10265, partial [bacterium]|nr:hypothetical protein [bacterium]